MCISYFTVKHLYFYFMFGLRDIYATCDQLFCVQDIVLVCTFQCLSIYSTFINIIYMKLK